MDGAAPAAQLALHLAQRTVALKIRQKPRTILEIQPDAQFVGVVTDNSVTAQSDPTQERIVSLDKLLRRSTAKS